ncbi:serine hydrolase domain-containing protein [Tenacibaculum halocynthiae]|uniref:serine hydrolase domain-containing protein n=1 Tax=Tenacibaculum halocynthiae TaxID=1254437 RepID=UPI003893D7DA
MRIFKLIKLSLLISVFPSNAIQSQEFESKIDQLISKTYTPDGPGISILIAKKGTPIYQKNYGKSNIELNLPINSKTVFQIGSITKQFTAIAILMLEEQGKLKLNDEIIKYIPEYLNKGNKITIHNLLNHTSGINGKTPISSNKLKRLDLTVDQIIDYFKNKPLKFLPGEQFSYSNSGYILLGKIIEIVSGNSYEDFIENNIFKKLGMTNTRYGYHNEIVKNRANGYQFYGKNYMNAPYISLSTQYAGGSILSTAGDLLKWQNALVSNILIKKSSFEKATSKSVLNNKQVISYGYGWYNRKINNSTVFVHGGATPGFMSNSIYLKHKDIYIIALTNCYCKKVKNIQKITYKIASLFTKNKKEVIINRVKLLENELNKWVGNYKLSNNTYIKIELNNGYLYGFNPKNKNIKHKLISTSKNDFIFENKKINFHFYISKNGSKKVKMSSGNRTLIGFEYKINK